MTMNNTKAVDNLDVPMSNDDIHKYLKGIDILTYADLSKLENITEVLPNDKCAFVLLAEREKNNGHWIAIVRIKKKLIYFDPLGYRVDKFLQWTPVQLRKSLQQDVPHLTALFNQAVDDGFTVVFNEFQYQDREMNASTCGRWVCIFVTFFMNIVDPTLHKFYDFTKEQCNRERQVPDLLVSKLVE